MHAYFQEWSKCVDDERQQDKDFTEECREKVTSAPSSHSAAASVVSI